MILRFGCWLVLLAACCVAFADVEVSTDKIELDNNTFADIASFHSEKCSDTNPCQNDGICSENVCSYLNGTSGHLTKAVDDCSRRCGNAYCNYNATSRDIYCSCDRGYAFDENSKRCRACNCGSYEKSCLYIEGKKKCACHDPYADKQGTCSYCYCMYAKYYNGCEFDDSGRKKCNCLQGYAEMFGDCEVCNCGKHGNCTFFGRRKTCMCEEGYAEKYGTCEECDCGEHGSCTFLSGIKHCFCKSKFAENHLGKCQECDCGEFSSCSFESNFGYNKKCTCVNGYALKYEVCTPCDCGGNAAGCTFNAGNKQCDCNHGFAENDRGKCEECDCQMDDSNCTIDGGLKKCHCPKGFEPSKDYASPVCIDKDECLSPEDNDCDPLSTRCVNTHGSYDCVCKEGFQAIYENGYPSDIKKYGCKDVDECLDYSPCIHLHTRCVNIPGSYRCECTAGYTLEKDSFGEKYNYCSESARPWKTASIVVGCLFGFISLGLSIAVCNKHCT